MEKVQKVWKNIMFKDKKLYIAEGKIIKNKKIFIILFLVKFNLPPV